MNEHTRHTPTADLAIGLMVALLGVGIAVVAGVFVAPVMLESGWMSVRGAVLTGSVGVTVLIGGSAATRYMSELCRRRRLEI